MAISYKPLWHLLVEREMNKEDLKRAEMLEYLNHLKKFIQMMKVGLHLARLKLP